MWADHPFLTDEQKTAIQGSVLQIRGIAQRVERFLAKNSAPVDVAKINGILALEIEKITEVLVSLKQEIKA